MSNEEIKQIEDSMKKIDFISDVKLIPLYFSKELHATILTWRI